LPHFIYNFDLIEWFAITVNYRAFSASDLILLFKEKFQKMWKNELEAFFEHAYPKIPDDLMKALLSLLEYNHGLKNSNLR